MHIKRKRKLSVISKKIENLKLKTEYFSKVRNQGKKALSFLQENFGLTRTFLSWMIIC